MAAIAWGLDGYGMPWPWCEDCGKQFGQISPHSVDHNCPKKHQHERPPAPRLIVDYKGLSNDKS